MTLPDAAGPPPPPGQLAYVWHQGQRLGLPTVMARVAGCDIRVLLDTGASHAPVLVPWLVDGLGLTRTSSVTQATDLGMHGAPISGIPPVDIDLDVGAITRAEHVIDDDGLLRRLGIGAVVGPQFALVLNRAFVLDFGRATYEKMEPKGADARVRGQPTFVTTDDCGDGLLRLSVAIEGTPATLILDTGSPMSAVYSESAAGRPLAARVDHWEHDDSGAFGSGLADEQVLPGVHVEVGSLGGAMWLGMQRGKGHVAPRCGFDGVLGTDFLIARRCVLILQAIEADGGHGTWFARGRGYCQP